MGKFFSSLWATLSSAARTIISVMLPVFTSDAGKIIAAALPYALMIVKSLMAGNASGASKRDVAVAQLKNVLISNGEAAASEIATSTLNLVVEMALAKLKTQ